MAWWQKVSGGTSAYVSNITVFIAAARRKYWRRNVALERRLLAAVTAGPQEKSCATRQARRKRIGRLKAR